MDPRSKPRIGAGWRSAALTALALAIVACSHHHNNGVTATMNTTNNTTTNFVSGFGTGFGADFGASNTSQPANVSTSDVNPVDPTLQPTSLANSGT